MNKTIAKMAKTRGICTPWLERMKTADLPTLCRMFFAGSDWALANDFPTLELLRQYRDQTPPHGLLVDYTGTITTDYEPETTRLAFFGDSTATVIARGYAVVELYARHNTRLTVETHDHAFVTITTADGVSVEVRASGESRVSRHGIAQSV